MIKIRLQGLPAEVEAAARVLRAVGTVLEESGDYANRGESKYVRRYMDVQFKLGIDVELTITNHQEIRVERLSLPAPKSDHS